MAGRCSSRSELLPHNGACTLRRGGADPPRCPSRHGPTTGAPHVRDDDPRCALGPSTCRPSSSLRRYGRRNADAGYCRDDNRLWAGYVGALAAFAVPGCRAPRLRLGGRRSRRPAGCLSRHGRTIRRVAGAFAVVHVACALCRGRLLDGRRGWRHDGPRRTRLGRILRDARGFPSDRAHVHARRRGSRSASGPGAVACVLARALRRTARRRRVVHSPQRTALHRRRRHACRRVSRLAFESGYRFGRPVPARALGPDCANAATRCQHAQPRLRRCRAPRFWNHAGTGDR